MIIVTGGFGFIGSNLIHSLNACYRSDITVVDDLTDGTKVTNLVDCQIADYLDVSSFRAAILADTLPAMPEVVFHQGACSSTTEWNGKYMLDNNFTFSKEVFHFCQRHGVPFIYASSAAVYGLSGTFGEDDSSCERPVNVYGYSKLLFDQYVRARSGEWKAQVVGLRYFNVYGPREQHKGSQASVAYHQFTQIAKGENPRLFREEDGRSEAEARRRDFVFVGDVVETLLWFFGHPEKSGIFNVGTGRAESFDEIAKTVIAFFGTGKIEYIDFPEKLKGHYQNYTCANISKLREAGFGHEFKSVAQGVHEYMDWLQIRKG
jgi:ADP-L-glycero-D-manno-heptose 6-epimerase